MNKENIRNIEFTSSDVIAKLNLLSAEYSVSFDALYKITNQTSKSSSKWAS